MLDNMISKEELYVNAFVIMRKDMVSIIQKSIIQKRIHVKFGEGWVGVVCWSCKCLTV